MGTLTAEAGQPSSTTGKVGVCQLLDRDCVDHRRVFLRTCVRRRSTSVARRRIRKLQVEHVESVKPVPPPRRERDLLPALFEEGLAEDMAVQLRDDRLPRARICDVRLEYDTYSRTGPTCPGQPHPGIRSFDPDSHPAVILRRYIGAKASTRIAVRRRG